MIDATHTALSVHREAIMPQLEGETNMLSAEQTSATSPHVMKNDLSPEDQKVVDDLREMFAVAQNRDTTLFDEEILAVAKKVKGTDDKADMERIEKMVIAETEVSKEASDLAIASEVKKAAIDFAQKAAHSEEILTEIGDYIIADTKKKRGAVNYLILLEKTYTKEEMDNCPIVGSGPEKAAGSNKLVDLYKVPGQAAKGSFYRDLALSFGPGKEAFDRYVAITGKVGDYAAMDDRTREGKAKDAKTEYELAVRLTRDAFRIHQKMAQVNELGHVVAQYDYDEINDEKVLTNSKRPIVIEQVGKSRNYQRKSVGEFLKCDPVKAGREATKLGGKPEQFWAELVKTMGKEPRTTGGDTATAAEAELQKKLKIDNLAKLEDAITNLRIAVENKSIDTDFTKQIGGKTMDEGFVKTFGDLYYWMDRKMQYLQPIYDRIIDEQAVAVKVAAEQERDRLQAERDARKGKAA